jgi:hypothetical protein
MICRNLEPEDELPWPQEQVGWARVSLDPRTVWVAIDQGKVVGMIVAAHCHQTLLILRVLGEGGAWFRPLWKHIRHACFHRGVVSYWGFADNARDEERRLMNLIKRDSVSHRFSSPHAEMTVVAGVWNASDTVSDMGSNSGDSRGGRDSRLYGLRVGEPTEYAQNTNHSHANGTNAGAAASAEGSVPGRAAQRASADKREFNANSFQPGECDASGSSIRSQLYRAIFGPGGSG